MNINEIPKEEIKKILIETLAAEILAEKRSKLNIEPPTPDTNGQDKEIFEEIMSNLNADEFNDDDVMEVGTEFIYDENADIETVIESANEIINFNIGGRF